MLLQASTAHDLPPRKSAAKKPATKKKKRCKWDEDETMKKGYIFTQADSRPSLSRFSLLVLLTALF
jgi:hypothetical protein